MTKNRKKLIEVALPLEAINIASAREKSIRHGHPSTLHLWWARRPLAAARAVIFAQMIDDPGSWPELFPTPEAQDTERQRLFVLIEKLVLWENTNNAEVINAARAELTANWQRTCADHQDEPRAAELFNPANLPAFHDPFAGGGALPLEAQRLGLESFASDLNPVAVLINKAMIEIPPRFADAKPVHPDLAPSAATHARGARGLAEDVRAYGAWMRTRALEKIGHLYPKVEITPDMVTLRPDLLPYQGQSLTVIAWLWARTVKSPNPAFAHIDVPLASTFMLSTKPGKEAYVEPVLEDGGYRFAVKVGKPANLAQAKNGTKSGRAFMCLMSNQPFQYLYVDAEANAGRMGRRMMAIVAEGSRGRVYLTPQMDQEKIAEKAIPLWKPELASRGTWASNAQGRVYGFKTFGDYFTPRQLTALNTFSDLVADVVTHVQRDAKAAGLVDDGIALADGGNGARAYGEAVGVYLGFAINKVADRGCSLGRWDPTPTQSGIINAFSRQGVSMTWDFAESMPLGTASGSLMGAIDLVAKSIAALPANRISKAFANDAQAQSITTAKMVSTDPPYYDNIGYADLSDFFYVWLRRSLKGIYPDLFGTVAVPKAEELVATPYRHGGKAKAEAFFLDGMTQAMHQLALQAHPAFPVTIYYAFKQSESNDATGTTNTGWDTFLAAVIKAGFALTGTWPMRTELANRMISSGTNALASSIVLVCRQRPSDAPSGTRREFLRALQAELPSALKDLQRGNIAPVDLAQAAIGPGMAVYTRYSEVIDAEGKQVTVREALTLINQVLDEALAEQEGDFDADSRWALTWFEQKGFESGEFGEADVLARAKNTSVAGLVEAGVLHSERGKVRLLKPDELPKTWNPSMDSRVNAWEVVHHLVRVQGESGEAGAAKLLRELGTHAETARELCYRLYNLCERKKRPSDALAYNGLVQAWPEISRLARAVPEAAPIGSPQGSLDFGSA
jgi:putative DNA methylase